MFDVRNLQKKRKNAPIKDGHCLKKTETLWAHSTAWEVSRSPQLHRHFTPTKPTTAPEDAAVQQLHVLHEGHPQGCVRVGEVWLHHGKIYKEKCFKIQF